MVAMAEAGPGCSQEPGTPSASFTWVTEAQVIGPFSIALPGILAGYSVGNRKARTGESVQMGYWHKFVLQF